ncbi:uncharacterized protein ARMOST_06073 [Armillaria ostoyae]|uniref:Uncharacterized protein n=1 Tax=Armillaria ostoyae TaxID=47428 RepID=A0A284R1Z5_ARMOS|nr:uncharacterized protein ARMOST_06073 [Armillaria ostoyae]
MIERKGRKPVSCQSDHSARSRSAACSEIILQGKTKRPMVWRKYKQYSYAVLHVSRKLFSFSFGRQLARFLYDQFAIILRNDAPRLGRKNKHIDGKKHCHGGKTARNTANRVVALQDGRLHVSVGVGRVLPSECYEGILGPHRSRTNCSPIYPDLNLSVPLDVDGHRLSTALHQKTNEHQLELSQST